MPRFSSLALALGLVACNTGAPKEAPKPEPAKSAAAPQEEQKPEGVLRLGEPIEKASAAQKVSLGDVAKNPNAFVGKSIVMKRFHARGRGRASRIEKPFSHLTIVVREVAEKEAA